MRSVEPVIAVWRWFETGGQDPVPAPAFGIDTQLNRLLYLGVSDPGDIFPGARAAIVWTGYDSSGKMALGALPLYNGQQPDPSHVVVSPISNAPGAVWIHASIIAHGVAVLDGASGSFCWVDYGITFHPGVVVPFPQDLREPIGAIVLNDQGEMQVVPANTGFSRGSLVLRGGVILREDAPYVADAHVEYLVEGASSCLFFGEDEAYFPHNVGVLSREFRGYRPGAIGVERRST